MFAVNAGRERLRQNDLPGAIDKFREAISLDPQNAKAHYQLGLALRQKGALAEARVEFQKAQGLAPYLKAPKD